MKKQNHNYSTLFLQFLFVLCLLLLTPFTVSAGTCSGANMGTCDNPNEACSCNQTNWQNCTDFGRNCSAAELNCHCTFKPDNQVDCNHTICPVGYVCVGSGKTSWCDKPSNNNNNECPWQQVNCPPGTIIDLSQPLNKFSAKVSYCPSPGTAQRETGVCTYMTPGTKSVCGDWYNCPTANNPGKMCRDCTEEEPGFCASREIQNYSCKPIIPPTVIKPSLTHPVKPSATPILTPVPLRCESLNAFKGGTQITSNLSSVKYGDTVVFVATTNNTSILAKSITFQLSLDGKQIEVREIPATQSTSGSWTAAYNYTFSTYGRHRVEVVSINPQ